ELLAALSTMVDAHERFEIIVDRRRGGVAHPPSANRRRQASVDVRLEMDGFAIVPPPSPSLARQPLDTADPDEPEFERVVEFMRQRQARRRRRLALPSLLGATLVLLLLTLVATMTAYMSQTRSPASPPAGSSAPAPPPAASPAPAAVPPPIPPIPPIAASPQSGESLQSPESTPPVVKRTGRPRSRPREHAAPARVALQSPAVAPQPSEGAREPSP